MHETSPRKTRTNSSRFALATCLFASMAWSGCSSGGGSGGNNLNTTTGVSLTAVHQGKLVDIYGLRTVQGSTVIELYQTDVLAGLDIIDERDTSSTKKDSEITYDFLSANPDTLQPRLLITREIGSAEFEEALDKVDDNVRLLSPNQFGRNSSVSPYSVVPRNAGLRLTFSGNLDITEDFFYTKGPNGEITGVKNTEAVQLLKIVGDPNDPDPSGDFEVVNTRISVRGNTLIIDPVLLGTEGLRFGSRNTASGMPASPDQAGANIRLAVALTGELSIDKVSKDPTGTLSGKNNQGFDSVIRDFRSGNADDNSPDISRGFIRDPEPPRIIGEMLMYLARSEPFNEQARLLSIYKGLINHEIDRGDQIRLQLPNGDTIGSLEVLIDPDDDRGNPSVQRVRVLVRPILGPNGEDILENIDPTNDPNFPAQGTSAEQSAWLRTNAPRAILVSEYTHLRPVPDPQTGQDPFYGDDPRNFIAFNPTPIPDPSGLSAANENISPFAGAIVRFNKPVDMATVIALDTAFFATRNVLDEEAVNDFINGGNPAGVMIEPSTFNKEKFKTPHLIHSRIFDENGSQTAIRVQPTFGFYLDGDMRTAAEEDKNKPFEERRFHYFLHLVGGLGGIEDLSGNALDFQADPAANQVVNNVVMEFSIDTRNRQGTSNPWFEDNIVAYVVRRFADEDEDEKPNLYLKEEVVEVGQGTTAPAWSSADFFGPISYLNTGEMIARPASRTTRVVDNLNQISPPPQTSNLRWCPITGPTAFNSPVQIVNQTASVVFGQPIQNPLNPYGCRLQTVWREIDMSLSRTDPLDFNLDVEQMYWAPFTANPIYFDEFDRISLFLGHCEMRPEACIASGSAFPSMPASGLNAAPYRTFADSYATNRLPNGSVDTRPERHPAFLDAVLTINSKDAILEPRGVNRFLPLPKFEDATKVSTTIENEYFVWRDELETVQGGRNRVNATAIDPYPYLLSPFLGGLGDRAWAPDATKPTEIEFADGGWYNANNRDLATGANEIITDGCVGTIALPLLADFWVYPDSAQLPAADPFVASGANGWQVSLAATSAADPFFRAYSAGRGGATPTPVGPSDPKWATPSGGFTPTGGATARADNTVYWVMADFIKRTAVVTSGFVEISDPHRMRTSASKDPRLGPYDTSNSIPDYSYDFEPPLSSLPAGTNVVTEFRGASDLDQKSQFWPLPPAENTVTALNFPNDPLKAGDAHIRHFDSRNIQGTSTSRQWWTYMYNSTVTSYSEDPNDLARTEFTNQFSGPNETFQAQDVKYFNWRFVMRNNIDASPPISPKVESFAVSYRLNER